MKELPMLYNTDMILAKMDGRKTQTRRPIKVPSSWIFTGDSRTRDIPRPAIKYDDRIWFQWAEHFASGGIQSERCPWKPGDILYARETWDYAEDELGRHDKKTKGDCFGKFLYKANGDGNHGRWRPSIHMPKEAARIWDRVVDVRVERLQDISEEDAIAEGAQHFPHIPVGPITSSMNARPERWSMESSKDTDSCVSSAKWAFAGYIDKISPAMNGNRIWAANPWVWVVKTETLSTTGKPQNLASPR